MELLFINCCMRGKETSRTYRLCKEYLDTFLKHNSAHITQIDLCDENPAPMDCDTAKLRDRLSKSGEFDHPLFRYALDFAKADIIVIGAPYWDLAFPALLKIYLEYVCVNGIAFCYTDSGLKTLCKAKKMVYITTSGGFIENFNFGGDYLKGLCRGLLGIPDFEMLCAQGLDIVELNEKELMEQALLHVSKAAESPFSV